MNSESGAIVTVYILGAALFFAAAIGAAFSLGKYVQSEQYLQRCVAMTAKGTMVYMQRQAPPNKGVLTAEAQNEGTYIFNSGICNTGAEWNPLMKATASITYEVVGSDTLLVTVNQYMKGYVLNRFFPIQITSTAAAYTYQYGGEAKNPVYGYGSTNVSAPNNGLLGGGNPVPAPSPSDSNAGETDEESGGGQQEAGGGATTSPSPSPSPTPTVIQATYENPYPSGTKARICHATSSANNPYNNIGPSAAGIINGHMGHTGIVFAGVKKSDWGDIIPPVPEANIQGLNWTPAGQAIWHNNCEYPAP